MFYAGKKLVSEQINDLQKDKHTITPLGVAKAIDGVIHEYYEQNYKQDITSALTENAHSNGNWVVSQRTVYSPYGMPWHDHTYTSQFLYLRTLTGFDGEQHDPVTGWQFLGAGHRTYNPYGRYFVSEDPAGDGYAFGSNNPVMHTDPSGNIPKWLGAALNVMKYAGTLGMAALHKRWANAVGTALLMTIATVTLGASLAAAAGPLVAVGVASVFAAAGGIVVTAAAVPPNKGLSIASAVAGGIQMAIAIATIGFCLMPACATDIDATIGADESMVDSGLTLLPGLQVGANINSATNDALAASANISDTSGSVTADIMNGVTDRPSIIATEEAKRLRSFLDPLEEECDHAMFNVRDPFQLANNMNSMRFLVYCLDSEERDQVFTVMAGAMQLKKLINLNTLAEYLEKTQFAFLDRIPASTINNLYNSLTEDLDFITSSSVDDIENSGNGLILTDQVKVFFSRSDETGQWFSVINKWPYLVKTTAITDIRSALNDLGLGSEFNAIIFK